MFELDQDEGDQEIDLYGMRRWIFSFTHYALYIGIFLDNTE